MPSAAWIEIGASTLKTWLVASPRICTTCRYTWKRVSMPDSTKGTKPSPAPSMYSRRGCCGTCHDCEMGS